MNILVVDDQRSAVNELTSELELRLHRVLPAANVADANKLLKNDRVDCIVADLSLSPEGLAKHEIQATQNGQLTGWVWLMNHVYIKRSELRQRTIIYSEYSKLLNSLSLTGVLGVKRVCLANRIDYWHDVIECVETIAQRL